LIVYYGLDRFANNGSAQVGFWFLQNEIGLTNIARGGGFEFSGVHTVGDILVQSNFSNGGIIDTISVYSWVGSGGSEGTLDLVFSAQDCDDVVGDTVACATVNTATVSAPWAYTPKFGVAGSFPAGSFFEGGINISKLVPDAGCFTGFLAETRSSTPFDSRLKDFALGQFDICSIDVIKSGDELSKVGDDVDYTITISNTGSVMLYKESITDTLLGDLSGSAGCGASLAPDTSCTITPSRTVLAGDPDPLPNVVTAVYRAYADLHGQAVTTLSNNSSADTPALDCTAVDTLLGSLFDDDLALGDTVIYDSRTVLAGDPDPLTNTVTLTCSPDGFPNVLVVSDTHDVDLFQPSIDVVKTGDDLHGGRQPAGRGRVRWCARPGR
jgi:uncharacterized repeat protein (TIGR01451 family)